MKTSHKGFIVPLIIIIIAVLAIGGTYMYVHNQESIRVIDSERISLNSPTTLGTSSQKNFTENSKATTTTTSGGTPKDAVTTCGLQLKVNGGIFYPTVCDFGPATSSPLPQANTGTHIKLYLEGDNDPTHIQGVVLTFNQLDAGTYTYSKSTHDGWNFSGLLTVNHTQQNLKNGTVTLEPQSANNKIKVTFNLQFEGNITIQGSGIISASTQPTTQPS